MMIRSRSTHHGRRKSDIVKSKESTIKLFFFLVDCVRLTRSSMHFALRTVTVVDIAM